MSNVKSVFVSIGKRHRGKHHGWGNGHGWGGGHHWGGGHRWHGHRGWGCKY